MLNYRNDANFYTDARQFIIGSEGFKNVTIYPDTVSIPTIGYGCAMLIGEEKSDMLLISGEGDDLLIGGVVRMMNWSCAICAVLFGRSKYDAVNDAKERISV